MNLVIPEINWSAIGPELTLSITAMVLLLLSVAASPAVRRAIPYLSLLGVALALLLCISLWGKSA